MEQLFLDFTHVGFRVLIELGVANLGCHQIGEVFGTNLADKSAIQQRDREVFLLVADGRRNDHDATNYEIHAESVAEYLEALNLTRTAGEFLAFLHGFNALRQKPLVEGEHVE
ncbi:Uncharacterised protein [uncultured archaeon]|nr:Uncharacterised protein [uncultured archaeon]